MPIIGEKLVVDALLKTPGHRLAAPRLSITRSCDPMKLRPLSPVMADSINARHSPSHVGDKNGHPFHRCGECGLLFVWPLPDGNLEIYSEDYFAGARDGFGYVDYDRDKSAMEDTFESYLDLLAGRHPQLGDLLDVGAATGFFLDLARRRGWKTCGVEPSKYASLVASQKNLTVHCGVLEELNLPDASFDVVTMWDVIEHVNDPSESLKAACRLLRPAV